MLTGSRERVSRNSLERFEVFGLSAFHDFWWQNGGWRLLVPRQGFEVVADELLVETRLAAPGFVAVGWPESRGVWREDFVDEEKNTVAEAELKFCVGDNNAVFSGMIAGVSVEPETNEADLLGEIGADQALSFFEGDIFVVTLGGFGCGCKDRFREFRTFDKARRQGNAANGL